MSQGYRAHIFELNGGYEVGGLSLLANYVLNEAGGAASAGGDKYFEAAAPLGMFPFVGGGDGLQSPAVTSPSPMSVSAQKVRSPLIHASITCSAILNPGGRNSTWLLQSASEVVQLSTNS